MKSLNTFFFFTLLFAAAGAQAQLPDAPSAVKRANDPVKVPFCIANPLSPACVVFRAPVEPKTVTQSQTAARELTFCDVNPLLAACSGFIPSKPPVEHLVGLRKRLVIADGTPVAMRLVDTLDSKRVQPGDPVELEVFENVKVKGAVVIARGARAWATLETGTHKATNVGVDFVRYLWRGQSDGNGGELVLHLNGVGSITGESVQLRGWAKTQGADAYVPAEGGVFTLAMIFLIKGDNVKMPRGTKVTGYVDGSVSLDEAVVRAIVAYTEHDRELQAVARRNTSLVHVYRAAACKFSPQMTAGNSTADSTPGSLVLEGSDCSDEDRRYGGKPRIFLDGKEVVRLPQGRYASIEVPAGEHTLRADDNEVTLVTRPGSEDYLRLRARGVLKAKGRLDVVELRVGEDAVFPLKPVDAKHIDAERRYLPVVMAVAK
ncbi:MAG TPA: hypothetical protein VM009_01125 [Terriglobales bacterium]|nr:hypothetical protein [Terriglobales bacterium]